MKILTYNVNGIRAALKKDFIQWLSKTDADVLCLQEIKAQTDQISTAEFEELGYNHYWFPAERKGYSGVAILSKTKPDRVIRGCGVDIYDSEGRILRADFGSLSLISAYIPSGSSGEDRQAFKMQFLEFFYDFIQEQLRTRPELIISGDYNICHSSMDIHDPISNAKSSGFLPEEREWFGDYLDLGLIDTFRYMNRNTVKYSWWSYRARAREKNLGWRIDYHIAGQALQERIKEADLLNDAYHSDHCPVYLKLE
jgi:exodeoxyribonuclease III